MNNPLHKRLDSLAVPEMAISEAHRQTLRRTLLAYGVRKQRGFFGWLGESVTTMFTHLKVSSFVLGAAAMLLVGIGVYAANNSPALAKYNPFATKSALAKAQMKDVLFTTAKLTSEQKAEISARFQADMQASLEEALQAKDLTYVNEGEEMDKGMFKFKAFKAASVSGEASGDALKDMNVVKRLKYTDKNGATVILGVNKDNIPVFKISQLSKEQQGKIEQEVKAKGFFGLPAEGSMELKEANTIQFNSAPSGTVEVQGETSGQPQDPAAGARVFDVHFDAGVQSEVEVK